MPNNGKVVLICLNCSKRHPTWEATMCCSNVHERWAKLFTKAMRDSALRERFYADPGGVAREFGFSETEQEELRKIDPRMLRARVEGPPSCS